MDIIKIAAICIISSILAGIFNGRKEYSTYIKIIAACGILGAIIIYISPVIDSINTIFLKTGADSSYLTVLFKSVGICYISQFAADICRDSGEIVLASHAELAGKVSLIIIALPMIKELTDIIIGLSGY